MSVIIGTAIGAIIGFIFASLIDFGDFADNEWPEIEGKH